MTRGKVNWRLPSRFTWLRLLRGAWWAHLALYVIICLGTIPGNSAALYLEVVPLWLVTAATCAYWYAFRTPSCHEVFLLTLVQSLATWGVDAGGRSWAITCVFIVGYLTPFAESYVALRLLSRPVVEG